MDLFYLLAKGGVLMIPIGITSVLGLAIIIERFVYLRKKSISPPDLSGRIIKLIKNNQYKEVDKLLQGQTSPLAKILRTVLKNSSLSRSELVELLEEKGRREAHKMGSAVEFIGVLAAVSPLLGLLGTVTGMISVFRHVMNDATVRGINPASLASGIWEALVTTAAGLSIAIPLYLFYRFLAAKVDFLVLTLEEDILKVVDSVYLSNKGNKK